MVRQRIANPYRKMTRVQIPSASPIKPLLFSRRFFNKYYMLDNVEIAALIAPYLSVLIGLTISLLAKDFVTGFAQGLKFRLNSLFNEGDAVIVDDEPAVIVKVGLRYTIFGIEKDTGAYVWRTVENARIPYLKLEKIIRADYPHRKDIVKKPESEKDED